MCCSVPKNLGGNAVLSKNFEEARSTERAFFLCEALDRQRLLIPQLVEIDRIDVLGNNRS